jgi:hypothetical protein
MFLNLIGVEAIVLEWSKKQAEIFSAEDIASLHPIQRNEFS